MTLLVLSVLLGLVAAAWVVVPVLRGRVALVGDLLPAQRLDAEARKRVALQSLREVEYDRLAGKLDDADYRALRSRLEHEALRAIRAAGGGAPEGAAGAHLCGFVNPEGSRFCAGCGVPLG